MTAIPIPNWKTWQPRERGVLCFIIKNNRILLIHKKRGLGAGKINGPGGRIDPLESPEQAAIRETQEEVGLTPLTMREAGVLSFQFLDGYSLFCHVFRADEFEGTPQETEEATPQWFALDAIPFHQMWQDDLFWIGHMIQRHTFSAFFVFNADAMLACRVDLH